MRHLKVDLWLNIIFYFFVFFLSFIIFQKGFNHFSYHGLSQMLFHSDFYINYESGFIRRGLDGEIIYQVSKIFNISPIKFQKIYSLIFLSCFFILMIDFIIKRKPSLFLILSTSVLLLFIMYIGYGLRKDHLMIVYFFLLIKTLHSKIKPLLKKILLNVIVIVGTLSHEIFFLISFFPLILSMNNFHFKNLKTFIEKTYFLAPGILIFLMIIFFFKGNLENEQLIVDSWKNLGLSDIRFNNGMFNGTLFITTLNLSLNQYIGLTITILSHLIFISLGIFYKITLRKNFILLLMTQYAMLILLCVVAIDFSRWIFFCNMTAIIIIYMYLRKEDFLPQPNRIYKTIAMVLYFFVGMQHVGWKSTTHYQALPFNIIKNYLTEKEIPPATLYLQKAE